MVHGTIASGKMAPASGVKRLENPGETGPVRVLLTRERKSVPQLVRGTTANGKMALAFRVKEDSITGPVCVQLMTMREKTSA